MNDSTEISPDDLILADFVRDFEAAGHDAINLQQWIENYPHLEERFRSLMNLHGTLEEVRSISEPNIPDRLGEFKIIRRLARGGMGDVYEAVQTSLNRRVAVKTIRKAKLNPVMEQRFLREQKILAALHQTHIVPIHTAGAEAELQYFAMPYINGTALSHVVKRLGSHGYSRTSGKTPTLAAR